MEIRGSWKRLTLEFDMLILKSEYITTTFTMTKAICERHLRCAVYAVYAVYACAADYMADDTPLALRRLV
jgi:hypothetical protein